MEGQNKGNVKFTHSVKVPRLYKQAAAVAKEAEQGKGSIKQLVYEKRKKHPNIKALYALVGTLYERKNVVDALLKRSQFFTKEPQADPWLTKILLVELIWGKKRLPGQSKPEEILRGYEQIFKAHLSDSKFAADIQSSESKVDFKPRYVRVNTLKITLNEAIDNFQDEGWNLVHFLDKTNYSEFIKQITCLGECEFMTDIHIPNLLIFPPKTQFYNHPAYKNGSIILQDKASCLPVHILCPNPESVCLDMCAAPGMKTTHLAAVINNQGTVYATERNLKRFGVLKTILESSGATCVQPINKDVLTCSASDFPGVEYILVDPSCSGSGMTDRIAAKQGEDSRSFDKLTGFQILILRSALTRYPDVKRVVYSTCSIYPAENEDVVRQVLETNYKFKLVSAKKFVNNTWQNFGSPDYGDIGKYCLYAKPHEDFTNGFFVAVFERLEEGEENQFFNTRIFNFKKDIAIKEKRKKVRDEKYKKWEEGGIEEDIEMKSESRSGDQFDENGGDALSNQQEDYSENHIGVLKNDELATSEEVVEVLKNKNKKKKRRKTEEYTEGATDYNEEKGTAEETNEALGGVVKDKKRKKKHKLDVAEDGQGELAVHEAEAVDIGKKKKKHRKDKQEVSADVITLDENEDVMQEVEEVPVKKKKKKSKKEKTCIDPTVKDETIIEESAFEKNNKPKKKKIKLEVF